MYIVRIIWFVSFLYFVLGILVLIINGVLIGFFLDMVFFRGLWMFFGGWDIVGFVL